MMMMKNFTDLILMNFQNDDDDDDDAKVIHRHRHRHRNTPFAQLC